MNFRKKSKKLMKLINCMKQHCQHSL